ncbi:MAG: MBL fold metallo-hydrolase [Planctomycetota bacterium]|jgi:glyoxylase-like metal-dependent hydrolase (beta-lactamase superfamily II)
MKIDRLILGAYETNCYILRNNDAANDCLVIDPGLEAGKLIDFLKQEKLNPVAVVLTHGHIDHIAGLAVLRNQFPDIKVYIHKLDAEMLTEPQTNLSAMTGAAFRTEPEDFSLEEQSLIEQVDVKLLVLHTPGHTPGGISLYAKDDGIVFVGDTLFADSIGRTDFPNGSLSQLLNSIKGKLFTLPDETKVYPGHGPITTVGHEKAYNPFLQ